MKWPHFPRLFWQPDIFLRMENGGWVLLLCSRIAVLGLPVFFLAFSAKKRKTKATQLFLDFLWVAAGTPRWRPGRAAVCGRGRGRGPELMCMGVHRLPLLCLTLPACPSRCPFHPCLALPSLLPRVLPRLAHQHRHRQSHIVGISLSNTKIVRNDEIMMMLQNIEIFQYIIELIVYIDMIYCYN